MFALQENGIFAERYILMRLIGTRAISEVWAAEDQLAGGALVALKIFAPLRRLDRASLDLLQHDVETNLSLSHPHILTFKSFEVYNETPYLVMPYMDKGSLGSRIQEERTLTEQEIALLLKQIGSALHYLHTRQPAYLHQNTKPDNILVADDGTFRLADAGLSQRTRSALYRSVGVANAQQAAYAPPEQFTAQPTAKAASDIFSFGVTLYEMCTGQQPWLGGGGLTLVQGAAVPYIPDTYSRVLSNIVRACMEVAWEKRPSAEELEAEGDYFLQHGNWKTFGRFGIVTVKMAEPEKEFPLKKVLIAAAVLILLCLGGYAFYNQRSQAPISSSEADAVLLPTGAAQQKMATVQEQAPPRGVDTTALSPERVEPATAATAPVQAPATSPAATAGSATVPPAATTTPAASPAVKPQVKKETKKPVRKPLRKPVPKASPYPRPTSLEGYFSELRNEAIPIEVRESWKPTILWYFTDRAAVNYVMRGKLIGVLSPDEIVDILLSSEDSAAVRISKAKRNDLGKIEEITVSVAAR